MKEPRSRLDDLNHIILSVANKNRSPLDLSGIPDGNFKLPENVLRAVPTSFKAEAAEPSLVHGLDFFTPGMKTVIVGGKSHVLNYIAIQKTTPGGLVINCASDTGQLEKVRKACKELSKKEQENLQFYYTPGYDLKTPVTAVEQFLAQNPVQSISDYLQLSRYIAEIQTGNPLIEDNSIDIVALDAPNCDVTPAEFRNITTEVYRILKKGGIFIFSLLLSDEKAEEEGYLWEKDLDRLTMEMKFHGLQWLGRTEMPHRVIDGKEIRCQNFAIYKGKEGPCMERKQALIYNGPWREVHDDDGHIFPRGKRVAVCDKTFGVMSRSPYKDQFTYLQPYIDVPQDQAKPFPCAAGILYRETEVTKGLADDKWDMTSQGDCRAPGDDRDCDDNCC